MWLRLVLLALLVGFPLSDALANGRILPYGKTPALLPLWENLERNQGEKAFTVIEPEAGLDIDRRLVLYIADAMAEPDSRRDPTRAETPDQRPEDGRWSSFLPLMAGEAQKRGIELPLPFGVSANMVLLNREINVKELKVGINSSPKDVSRFLALDTSTSVFTGAARFDAWVLPFLNVYMLGGYISNSPDLTLRATIPKLWPPGSTREVAINATGDMDGSSLGAGLTFVGGYRDFFLSLDANINHADMGGAFDQTIDAKLYTARLGWRGQVGNAMMNVWGGAMYWDSEREISGSFTLDGGDRVNFEVLQGPENPVNMCLGMNVEISRAFQMVTETGFNGDDMLMLIFSMAYRF